MNSYLQVFLGGLALGLLIGALGRDIATEFLRPTPLVRKVTMRRSRPSGRILLTVALVAAVLLQFVVGALLITTRQSQTQQGREQAAYSRCTAQWQQEFATAYRARLAASTPVDNAQDAVFRAVAAKDPAGFKSSLAAYVKLRDAQAQTRRTHPLPPLPTELCGKPGR